MTTYTDVFGNDTIPPAGQSYAAVTLSADTQFYWPEMPGSANVLASVVNVTASSNYALKLPDASQVSTGRDCLIYNVGANTFTIADSTGSTLFTVSAGVAVFVYLTDNSTAAGTWSTFTFGAGTAATASAALAGNGLKALNNLIVANELVSLQPTDYTVVAGDRAHLIAFTSGSATCTLPTTSSVDDGFFFAVRNSGSGTITLTPSGGVYIDGAASKAIAPTEALICYTDGTDWHTVGHGRSTSFQFTAFVKDLTGIAAYTMTTADAANKLLQFTGAPSANTTITIPSVVAVYYVQINTSNAYTVAFETATGTTVTLNQNDYAIILCDGVDTVLAQTASTPPNVSVATGMLANTNGGTGQNSSAWTGVPQVVAGTWSAAAAVAANYGGTGVANNAANTITFSGNYGLTLTLSNTTGVTLPTTGTLAALGVAQSWTAAQTYDNSMLKLKGSSTGVTTFTSANAGASNYTLTLPAATDTVAALGTAQSWTAAQNFSDQTVSRAILVDCAEFVVDKGNISAATVTFDYSAGSVQTYTATGSTVTWAFSNWPPTGNEGYLLIRGTNMGAYTHSISGITWLKPDGTTTTSVATYLAANTGRTAFQTSGVDQVLLWTRDSGTTIYGKLV